MAFEITITRDFSASHQLRLYDGSLEPLHGHNWHIVVCVSAKALDPIGVVMDFHDLERRLNQIVDPMHNRHLNEIPAFASRNPSAENGAAHVAESLTLPAEVTLERVEAWETANCRAAWRAASR